MAMFKVGQRVRVIGADTHPETVGLEGVVVDAISAYESITYQWIVSLTGAPQTYRGPGCLPWPQYNVKSEYLAPLTDPAADAFIASIKSLRPYEEPLRTLTEREMDKITGGVS